MPGAQHGRVNKCQRALYPGIDIVPGAGCVIEFGVFGIFFTARPVCGCMIEVRCETVQDEWIRQEADGPPGIFVEKGFKARQHYRIQESSCNSLQWLPMLLSLKHNKECQVQAR